MSQVFLTAALGLITTSMAETRQNIFILDRFSLSRDAKSWLGFLVLLGLAAGSLATALVVYPGEAIVPYG